MFEIENFYLFRDLTINVGSIISVSLIGLIFYFIRFPHKFEKAVAFIHKHLKSIWKSSEYLFVKYDIQGTINSFIHKTAKKAPHLDIVKAKIEWIDENQSAENYIKNGELIIRMHRSDNPNRNVVYASMAFIATSFLKKAKSYVAQYQREAIDLYACYDLLQSEKRELLDQFTQDFLKGKMTNQKIGDFFEKFMDIDKAGIFYPIFVQEMTFFGEKVFTRKRNSTQIYDEIQKLVVFLYRYSQKKRGEDIETEFNGEYCKFAIRIIGKSRKIMTEGEEMYKRSLDTIPSDTETLYVLGALQFKDFIQSVFDQCKDRIGYDLIEKKEYKRVIKDQDGNDLDTETYLLIARNKKIKTVHRN